MNIKDKDLANRVSLELFIKLHDTIWSQIKFISTLQVGTLTAWYYLYSQREPNIALLIIILSSTTHYILYLTIRRYSQLQTEQKRLISMHGGWLATKENILLPLGSQQLTIIERILKTKLYGQTLAKLIPLKMILINFILIFFTFYSMLINNHISHTLFTTLITATTMFFFIYIFSIKKLLTH